MALFSYCLRFDDGAAPNPYWGVCTLVICKPAIRRVAQVGDWIIGTGSSNVEDRDRNRRDFSGKLVYAMKVTSAMPMEEYDLYCGKYLKGKIPNWGNSDYRRRVGDCIYDFSRGRPVLRESVHDASNQEVDISGKNALLSTHFYYFGDHPIDLPPVLREIEHRTQGHKSRANEPYVEKFEEWISSSGYQLNSVNGEPQLKHWFDNPSSEKSCAAMRKEEGRQDKRVA